MQPGSIASNMTIVDKRINNSYFWGFHVERSLTGNKMLFALFNSFSSLDYHYSDRMITENSWSHGVAVVRNDTSFMYLDGVLDSVSPITISRPINTLPLTIGSPGGDSRGESFVGWIDDIRIYNRALSQTEINTLYHEGGWAPVPVQLASFSAVVLNNWGHVSLRWMTLSETNNYGFEVQKSVGQTNQFQTIPNSFISGHGTSLEPHHYGYIDTAASVGRWFYRLKQIDLDGAIHYSEGISVDVLTDMAEEVIPAKFSLSQNYPNPFNPVTQIRFAVQKPGHTSLVVYNTLGEVVATLFDGAAEAGRFYYVEFDASNLSSGIYFYRLSSGDKVQVKKLILMR